MRDDRNEPMNVSYVAEKIAEVRDLSIDDMEKITAESAKKVSEI
ncbi:TatD family hydrolase [Patescibacteria group bacterium]